MRLLYSYKQVYTASEKAYADSIIALIDPFNYITYRIYRDHCIKRNNCIYLKDLRMINRDMRHCLAVDNSIVSFQSQLEYLIPIKSFIGNSDDVEFIELMQFLSDCKDCDDFKEDIHEHFIISNFLINL